MRKWIFIVFGSNAKPCMIFYFLKILLSILTIIYFFTLLQCTTNIDESQIVFGGFPNVASYLCERAFSFLNHQKDKKRNNLDVKFQLRIELSDYTPNFEELIKKDKCRKSRNMFVTSDEQTGTEISDNEDVVKDYVFEINCTFYHFFFKNLFYIYLFSLQIFHVIF